MVFLSKIYTRSGDQGETGLGDGTRVPKDHLRVVAYGCVDEVNATLGLLAAHLPDESERSLIQSIQNDLFDVGGDLCIPQQQGEDPQAHLRVKPEQATRLEKEIDRLNADLEPLTSFVLPGGSLAASWCHFARTRCRAAEREVVALSRDEEINGEIIIYLNRLSDFLFVLARALNDLGKKDVLWRPGQSQKKEK